jgi:hypothetical protein
MTKKKEDGHRQGKNCGYEILPDGRISVAPVYADEMEIISNEKIAVETIIKSTMATCKALLVPITAREKRWWNKVIDDYGLTDKRLSYSNGVLSILPDEAVHKEEVNRGNNMTTSGSLLKAAHEWLSKEKA